MLTFYGNFEGEITGSNYGAAAVNIDGTLWPLVDQLMVT